MHSALKEVTDKYGQSLWTPRDQKLNVDDTNTGSLVRVGPNDLVTNDADIMRKMMAVRSPYTRGPW